MEVKVTYNFTSVEDLDAKIAQVTKGQGYNVLHITRAADDTGTLLMGIPDWQTYDAATKTLSFDQDAYDADHPVETLKKDTIVATIIAASFADIDTWADNNITTVAQAKAAIVRLLKLMKIALTEVNDLKEG